MLDHLVYGVSDLKAGQADLDARLGVCPSEGGSHPGRGTHNALLDLGGGAYLEVIAPDPAQPPPAEARAHGLDAMRTAGLISWAARGTNLEARVAAARAAGYDPGAVRPMSRLRPDGGRVEWRLTRRDGPPAGDGLVPFLIDWGDTPHPAESAAHGCTLVQFRGLHPRPDAVRPLLKALGVDLEVVTADAPALSVVIDCPKGRVELR